VAYAVIVEVPGGTLERYDAIGAAMGFQGDGEKGREGVRKAGLPAYAHREFELHNIVK
jgi:hypothetical protein